MSSLTNLVSIILPVYNGEQFLSESIESCLAQTHKNIELIIINDCSTDGSLIIAKRFADRDERVRVHTNPTNLRLPASLNEGHRLAKGSYITWTSDDNRFRESAIENLLKHLREHKLDLVYSHCDVIDDKGQVCGFLNAKDPSHLLFENVVGASFLYTRTIYDQVEPYDKDMALIEDYDFWLRVAKEGRVKELPQTLYEYRQHEDTLTTAIQTDLETGKAFSQRKRTIFERALPKRLENPEEVIQFLIATKRDAELLEKIIQSPSFFKDFKTYVAGFRAVHTENTIKNLVVWFAETILLNKELQRPSVLTYLYKKSKTAIKVLPLKRQAALAKKCL